MNLRNPEAIDGKSSSHGRCPNASNPAQAYVCGRYCLCSSLRSLYIIFTQISFQPYIYCLLNLTQTRYITLVVDGAPRLISVSQESTTLASNITTAVKIVTLLLVLSSTCTRASVN